MNTMKKIAALAVISVMIASLLALSAGAVFETDFADLKFTLIGQTLGGVNMIDDDVLLYGQYCMRGFTVSTDGKYAFGGYLNPGNTSAVARFNLETGHADAYYQYAQTEGSSVGTVSYPKGLDCDDRGYLYVGLAYNPNKIRAYFAVLDYETVKDDMMKEVSVTSVFYDEANTKIGVNGLKVRNIDGKYYCYIILNYDEDYLYRYDVTTPETPVLDKTFGADGRVNLQKLTVASGAFADCNYLDIGDDGAIYIAYKSSGGAGLAKLSADGNTVLTNVEQTKGYGVCIVDDYVLCSGQSSPCEIVVYSMLDLSKVTSFAITEQNTVLPYPESYDLAYVDPINSIVTMRYYGGVLYLADQGSGSGDLDQIFAVGLTDEGKTKVAATAAVLEANAKALNEETTAESTIHVIDIPTQPEETTAAAEPEATTAPEEVTTAGDIAAPETTAAPTEKKGCKSSAVAAAVIPTLAMLGCAPVFIRRKH